MFKSRLFYAIIFAFTTTIISAQDTYYWVGGTGNWSDISHWATTSGGSTFHVAPPWVEDTVVFDANSFLAANETVSVDEVSFCASLISSTIANQPEFILNNNLTIDGSVDLLSQMTINIASNLYIKGSFNTSSDVTYTGSGLLIFNTTISGNTIATNGATLGRLNFSGAGAGWILEDALNAETISLASGTLDLNGQDVTTSTGISLSANDDAILDMGTSRVQIGNYFTIGDSFRSGHVDADSAHIIFTGFNSLLNSNRRRSVNYDLVEFNGVGEAMIDDGQLSHFNKLIVNSDIELDLVNVDSLLLEKGTTCLIRATLTANNHLQADSITMKSVIPGAQATLTMPSGIDNYFTHITLQDVNAAGGATFTAGEGSVDLGNNTGWIFEFDEDLHQYFWVGGSGNWSDVSHWAMTSGGSEFHDTPPSVEDTVILDVNSFSGSGQFINIDQLSTISVLIADGVTNNPRISVTEGLTIDESVSLNSALTMELVENMTLRGSFTGSDGVTFTGYRTLIFNSSNAGNTITSAGTSFGRLSFSGTLGTWSLVDGLTAELISLSSGRLDFNDQNVILSATLSLGSTNDAFVDMGTSRVEIGGSFIIGDTFRSADVDADSATIVFTGHNSTFNGNKRRAIQFHEVLFNGTGEANMIEGQLAHFDKIVSNSDLEMEKVTVDSLLLAKGTTNQIKSSLTVNNHLQADSITLESFSQGIQATLSMPAGIDNYFTNITVQDINATGGATFTAGEGSIDAGNNLGWVFEFAVDRFRYYWVGGTGNWSDLGHWAIASGGSELHEALPSIEDTVIFDANSFATPSQIVTVDQQSTISLLLTDGVQNNPTLYIQETLTITKSVNFVSPMIFDLERSLVLQESLNTSSLVTYTGNGSMYFYSTMIGNTLNTSGANMPRILFSGPSGEWNIMDALQASHVTLSSGTLNFNDQNIIITGNLSTGTSDNTYLNMGTSVVEIGSSFTIGDSFRSALVDADSAILRFTGPNPTLNSNRRRPVNYHQVEFIGSGEAVIVDGQTDHYNKIVSLIDTELDKVNVDTLLLSKGSINEIKTQVTINNFIQADSTTIRSFSPGFQANVIADSLTNCFEYLQLRDLALSEEAFFTAALGSIDLGNNSGWIFEPDTPCSDVPLCIMPSLSVSNLTDSSATISWIGNADTYNLWYRPGPAAQWTEMNGVVSPVELHSLLTGTRYNVRLYGSCNGTAAPVANTYFDTQGPETCETPNVGVSNVGSNSMQVNWSGNAIWYKLRYRAGFGSQWTVVDSVNSGNDITGLASGTSYNVQVRGYCDNSTSNWGVSNVKTTGAVTCPGPGATVDNITETSATISWTGTSDSYLLRYRSGSGKWTSILTATSPVALSTLVSGTRYTVRVYGQCGDISSAYDQIVFETPGEVTCEQPIVSIGSITDESALVSWTANSDSYVLRYRAGVADQWNRIMNAVSPVTLSSLSSGTKYDVRVLGLCGEVSSINAVAKFTTTGPVSCASPDVQISNVTNTEATINLTGNAAKHNLWYKPQGGGWTKLNDVSSLVSLSNLVTGTRYVVRVFGECDGVTSLPVTKKFTTSGPAACEKPEIAISSITDNTADVNWTGNASSYVLRYRAGIEDTWVRLDDVNAPFTLNNLASGTKYDVRVFGKCNGYNSLNGIASFTTTGPETCVQPATSVDNITDQGAEISWSGNATGYNLWYKPNKGQWVKINDVSSPQTLSALSSGTRYIIRVYAECNGITALPANNSFTTTGEPVCQKPEVLASDVQNTSASISWTGNASSYNLRYRAGIADVWKRMDGISSPVVLSTLSSGTRYNVRVEGECGGITSSAGALNFTIGGPETCAQPNITISNIADTSAEIDWTGNGDESYLWHKVSGGSWVKDNMANAPYLITNLDPATDYIVRVYNACNGITSVHDQETFSTTGGAGARTHHNQGADVNNSKENLDDDVSIDFSIYPNPSKGKFFFKTVHSESDIDFRLYNGLGQIENLLVRRLGPEMYELKTNANNGVFVLFVRFGNKLITRKIAINH